MPERVVKVRLAAMVTEYNQGMLQAAQATRTVGTEAEKLAQKREAFETVGRGLAVAGAAMVAATALTVRAAAQWESAWAGVTKTVDGTPEQLAEVEAGLRGLTKVLPASHQEIAAVAEAAGQLGVQTDNVVAFTRVMIDLGETTNLSANDAATALARFTNIMGTSQDKVSNLGSALVGLGNNYATTESEILEMSMRLAGAGRQIGLSEGDVLGLATALSSVGIEAEAGGSAMSKVMIDIASSVEKGGERVEMFAKVAGLSAAEFSQKWRTAPADALSVFVKGLANAESQGSSTLGVLAELGITEVRMRDALLRSASAADEFSGAMAAGNEEFEKGNALTNEAAKRYETVESKMAIAGNAVNDAAISFGQVLLPAVGLAAEAVAGFAGFMGDLPGPVQAVVAILAGLTGALALAGGTALLAVPKFAQMKLAMDTLGWSMRGLATAGGIVGGALTALVAVIGLVASAQADARQRAEAYADAMNTGEDAVRDLVVANLAAKNSFLFWEKDSAFDAAEKLGIGLDLLTDAAMGSASAMREVDKALDEAKAGSKTLEMANAIADVEVALGREAAAQDRAKDSTDQKSRATKKATDATEDQAGELEDLTGVAEEAAQAVDELADSIRGFGSSTLDAREAERQFHQAVADADAALAANGATLANNTQEGRDNAAALDDIAQAAKDTAAAILIQTGSEDDATAALERGRAALIEKATQFGMTADEAAAYADSVVGDMEDVKGAVDAVPGSKAIAVTVEGAYEASTRLDWVARNRTAMIRAQISNSTVTGGPAGNIGGDLVNYAGNLYDRGQAQAFYQGGFPSGVYAGVLGGRHKFAESEMGVPWETYISGRAADRNRNVGIWQETGRRLGVGAGAGEVNVSLDGGSITGVLEIGGDGLARIVDGRIRLASYNSAVKLSGGSVSA